MTMTTLVLPHKELRLRTNSSTDGDTTPTWDLYLDGTHIASGYASKVEAQRELDLVAWYALFGEAPLSPDIPLVDEALGLAMTVFNRCFSTLKVQEKARVALEQIIRTGIYTINIDGSLSVLASSGKGRASAKRTYAITAQRTPSGHETGCSDTYTVSMVCDCRDFWTRADDHGGVCKHIAARLLLFLAQRGVGFLKHLRDALDMPAYATIGTPLHEPDTIVVTDTDTIAFLDISAIDLLAALFLASRGNTPIEFRAESGVLRLIAPPIDLTFPCTDGAHSAVVYLETGAVTALYEQLRPVAKSIATITIFIAPADGSVVLCGCNAAFSATAQGTTLPFITPESLSESDLSPILTSAPIADIGAVEALHELFTLLEAHEPAWYQRRHYRIAYAALHSAGRIV